jgi:hypothetical protein
MPSRQYELVINLKIQAGGDAEAAARKVLREKHGKHLSFYDPISYRGHVV